jgi:hypothetical protein
VHVLAALAAVFALLVTMVVVLAVVFVDLTWEHGRLARDVPPQTQITGDEAVELARRFAPVLRYDSKERFVPISRGAYLSRTKLKEEEGGFARTITDAVDEGALPDSLGACLRGCLLFLDVRGAEPDPPHHSEAAYDKIENELLRSGARKTVYFHVSRYDDTNEYAVQYWFLYFFNYRLNEHESDWEQITVHLDENRKPVDVFYSAHEGGNRAQFAGVADGEHPVVYPARGSHANYFRAGKHDVALVCQRVLGSIKQCLHGGINDVSDAKGAELRLADYDLAELTGPVYVGSYGSGNYVVLTRKPSVLGDPRVRGAWLDPLRPLG